VADGNDFQVVIVQHIDDAIGDGKDFPDGGIAAPFDVST
jgi:hypothetical protein